MHAECTVRCMRELSMSEADSNGRLDRNEHRNVICNTSRSAWRFSPLQGAVSHFPPGLRRLHRLQRGFCSSAAANEVPFATCLGSLHDLLVLYALAGIHRLKLRTCLVAHAVEHTTISPNTMRYPPGAFGHTSRPQMNASSATTFCPNGKFFSNKYVDQNTQKGIPF